MLRLPPISTLFPYTTLFRSCSCPAMRTTPCSETPYRAPQARCSYRSRLAPDRSRRQRSEEHTSELQSPYDLVCRLLLEKKEKKKTTTCTSNNINSHLPSVTR